MLIPHVKYAREIFRMNYDKLTLILLYLTPRTNTNGIYCDSV